MSLYYDRIFPVNVFSLLRENDDLNKELLIDIYKIRETDDSIETNNLFIYFHNSRPYLANINDTFDFEDYDGDTDEQNIFNGYVQIKNYTDSIIVKLAGNIFGASASHPDIFQRIQLGNSKGSFFPAAADVEGLSKFTKPEGWEEGDVLPTLEITRVTEVVSTPLSGAFDDKVKDLSKIKDITIW